MISLSREDGARKNILEFCTRDPQKNGSSIDVYTTFPWEALGRQVAKLVIYRTSPHHLGELRALIAAAVGSRSDGPPDDGSVRSIPSRTVELRVV